MLRGTWRETKGKEMAGSAYEKDGRNTSSNDPKMLDSRVFIGNLPSDKVGRQDIEKLFNAFGKVLGVSLHKSYGFVQFDDEESAKKAVAEMHGHKLHGLALDVNLAAERRKERPKVDKDSKEDRDRDRDRDRSRHYSSSRSSHSSSSRHHHHDDDYRSSRHRDRDYDHRDRDRYRRDRSYSPPLHPRYSEMEYRARLRHMERMRGLPPFFDHPLGPPPPFGPPPPPPPPPFSAREHFMMTGGPRGDDPYDMMLDRFPPPHAPPPPPPPPPGRMRDPYPEAFDRMGGGPPPSSRDSLYDRPQGPLPPRPLTPPPERRERERGSMLDRSLIDRGSAIDRGGGGLDRGLGLDRGGSGRGGGVDKMTDMEIVVVNRQQKEYGEQIRTRVERLGLVVDTVHLSPTVSLADALDAAANRGLLYAIIVTSQHELHRSVTLTILHGRNPQEHKNMPLEDALGLVDRDFERYTQGVREGRILPRRPTPHKSEVSSLLTQAASGEHLSPNQLQQVIDALEKQKQHRNEPAPAPQLPAKEDIQRQQADLQAKILSLLGSNAVVPPSPSQGRGYDNGAGGGTLGGRGNMGRPFGGGGGGGRGSEGGGGRGYGQGGYGSGY